MKLMKKINMRMIATSISLILASVSAGTANAQTDTVALNNELEIMTNIMRTSLGQGNKGRGYRVRGIDVLYLANQGVLFEVSTSSSGSNIVFEFISEGDFVVPPIPPIPPSAPVHGGSDSMVFSFNDDEWEDSVEEAVEHARHAMEEARDKLRELRQQEREFGWEERNYERSLRDIEFEMRNADKDRKEELVEQQKEIAKDLAKVKAKQQETEKYAAQFEQQQKQKAAEKQAARQKQYTTFLTMFENNIADTLCKYGNGIRALPSDENVSFVLSNMGNGINKRKQDKVYVFSNQDIQSCVKDKLSAKQLLSKAQSYSF